MKTLEGYWGISDVHKDVRTGFIIGEPSMFYGTLSQAIENTIHHKNTQELRFEYRGKETPSS